MKHIIFTEEFCQPENMYPFTLTRRMQDMRVGILTIREKWELALQSASHDKKENDYKDFNRATDLRTLASTGDCLLLYSNVLPDDALVKQVRKLKNGEYLLSNGSNIAARFSLSEVTETNELSLDKAIVFDQDIKFVKYPWDLARLNAWAIAEDIKQITHKRKSKTLSSTNTVVKGYPIFIEKDATVEHCLLNASFGPIYVGRHAEIMEGSMIRGPFSLGEGALIKMGAKIYGATTIGPYCVAAGEIKNSVMFGYSNKAHDGYLGDAVIGEWCNMGAGTTNSNLKNNAGIVKMWTVNGPVAAGNKCGVMMGDYARTAINTSINTGTTIGVGANVFGNGLTPKYIPNFSWGTEGGKKYEVDRALKDIDGWKKLKGHEISPNEITVLRHIYQNFKTI